MSTVAPLEPLRTVVLPQTLSEWNTWTHRYRTVTALTLDCGHVVKRWNLSPRRVPRRTRCFRCLAATIAPATVTEVMPDGSKRFRSSAPEGLLYAHEFSAYYDALTDGERESLRHKARWEAMSLAAVAREWGAWEIEPVIGERGDA